jgi:hypothetical protein
MAGTGISIHSLRGRPTVLDARGVERPSRRARRFLQDLRLAEHRGAGVGGVAQHAPDHRAVPLGLAGARGDAFAGEPAGQVGDGGAVVGVAAEQLGGDRRLVVHDLVSGSAVCGLVDVAVAERGRRPGR